MIKSRKSMTITISLYGVGVLFYCCRGADYGSRCDKRDNGSYCMACKYCKAEMSGFDALRLLNKLEKVEHDGKGKSTKFS